MVHTADDRGAVASVLKRGVDVILAKDCGFPLSWKRGEVRISVVDDTIPAAKVS
jgi:hypothetical protein